MRLLFFSNFYFHQDERLAQRMRWPMALFGGLGFIGFYFLLSLWPHYWESLGLRLAGSVAMASLIFLPSSKPFRWWNLFHFELVFTLCFPTLFTYFLFQNHVNLYWSYSVIFAAVPFGMLVNPPRALLWYPLGCILALAFGSNEWKEMHEYPLGLLLLIPGYFMVMILGVMQTGIQIAEKQAEIERARSEELLHNILPISIANRLKQRHMLIADHIPECSILFADIVGFTRLSKAMTPAETVSMLDHVFSRFDFLSDELGLEKIKTIGDAYLLASGIPEPREDHAQAIVQAALAMLAIVREFNAEHPTQLEMRIGIHSGPVVAGVIGERKFTYDVWGDTVNTAKSMESTGLAGRIQISETTHAFLQDSVSLIHRGEVIIKGDRNINTWWVQEAV